MIANITLGQYFPGHSLLHLLDPRVKIICTLLLISGIFLAENHLTYGLIGGFTLLCIAVSGIPAVMVIRSLKPLWIIIVFTMAIHVFTTPGEVIWQFSFLTVTFEGVRQGLLMTARLVFLITISSLLTFTTSPIVLTDGIERLLNPFKRVGLPAHELAMMMTIALRFIPTLLEETDRIMKAQMARGADFSSGNLLKRAKNMVPLLVPLFISAFRRADELATAMEARCYRGGDSRTRMKELNLTMLDGAALLVVIFLVVLLGVMRWWQL